MSIKILRSIPQKVHDVAHWPSIPFLLFAIVCADFIFLFIPSDLFLIAAILGYQRRTVVFAASMLAGRVAGTAIAYALSGRIPLEQIHRWATQYHLEAAWTRSQYFFEKFGALSVGIVALSPFPMLFPTLMGGVAGAPAWQVILFAAIGSGVRYAILCFAVINCREIYLQLLQKR